MAIASQPRRPIGNASLTERRSGPIGLLKVGENMLMAAENTLTRETLNDLAKA